MSSKFLLEDIHFAYILSLSLVVYILEEGLGFSAAIILV